MEAEMKKEFGETKVLNQIQNDDNGLWGGYRGEGSYNHLALEK